MRKFFQSIFCYRNIPVTDPQTGKKEIAEYQMLFGLPFRIKYTPISDNRIKSYLEKWDHSSSSNRSNCASINSTSFSHSDGFV